MYNKLLDRFNEILRNKNLTKEQKEELIKNAHAEFDVNVDKERNLEIAKDIAGAGLEIGSAAIPAGRLGKGGIQIGENLLKKKLGKKISQEIGSGAVTGAETGAVFGLGRGMLENKNPLETSLEDSATGMAGGAVLGGLGGKIQKVIKGKNLKDYGDIDKLSQVERKQYNNDTKNFYQDYVQGIEQNKNGDFDYTKRGVQEVLRWNPKQGQNFPDLTNDIKNAKRLPDEPNLKPEQKPYVSHYEVYQGQNGNHYIEVLKNGDKRYYTTKDTPTGTPHATSTGSNGSNNIITNSLENFNPRHMAIPEQKPDVSHYEVYQGQNGNHYIEVLKNGDKRYYTTKDTPMSTPQTTSLDTHRSNNIITNSSENFNPRHMAIPASAEFVPDGNGYLKTGIEMNVDRNGNQIFTAEDIGKMSKEEFEHYSPIIDQQLKDGLIKNKEPDYANFINPISNSNKIYTREEIGNMTYEEYSAHEKEILEQLKRIGIPTLSHLKKFF